MQIGDEDRIPKIDLVHGDLILPAESASAAPVLGNVTRVRLRFRSDMTAGLLRRIVRLV
jgi:hypothetical protein